MFCVTGSDNIHIWNDRAAQGSCPRSSWDAGAATYGRVSMSSFLHTFASTRPSRQYSPCNFPQQRSQTSSFHSPAGCNLIRDTDVVLQWCPVSHVSGMAITHIILSVGATCIIGNAKRDIPKLIQLCDSYQVSTGPDSTLMRRDPRMHR